MNIVTKSGNVWLIGRDVSIPKPIGQIKDKKKWGYKKYYCDSHHVGVVYLEKEKKVKLYIGHFAPQKKVREYVFKMSLKFDIEKVEIQQIESISDLRQWDKLVDTLNKILASQ